MHKKLVTVEGNMVVTNYEVEGAVSETGERLTMEQVNLYTYEDRLIREVNLFYLDTHKFVEKLG